MIEYYRILTQIKDENGDIYKKNKEWVDGELVTNEEFVRKLDTFKEDRNRVLANKICRRLNIPKDIRHCDDINAFFTRYLHDGGLGEEATALSLALYGDASESVHRKLVRLDCLCDAYTDIRNENLID